MARQYVAATLIVLCSCSSADMPPTQPDPVAASSNPVAMTVQGRGNFLPLTTNGGRYSGEIAVRGTTAYTTTWNNSSSVASVFYVWDVSAAAPRLVDSVKVDSATTLGDIQVSDDGTLLVVATEYTNGSIVIYDLADPRKPQRITRFRNGNTTYGVHTAKVGRVNGKLYGFLCIDPVGPVKAQIVIVDLSDPANPKQVYQQAIGTPYVHDTFLRDGILFLALWNDGLAIWDVGGGALGGTPAAPKEIGRVKTANGKVHNVWWLKDPVTGNAKYAFVGEEGANNLGTFSVGDIHVVDVGDMSSPKEVAFFTTANAGTHNFSVDEANGILYAAYYNGGVRALDVRGDLSACAAAQRSSPANTTLQLCDLFKMGRELGIGLQDQGNPVLIWGVQYRNGLVYASDMINGIWKLTALARP
ncbi:MAG TPA: hypothetical protein VF929_04500 [Gemmatimonadaceae bacterium]